MPNPTGWGFRHSSRDKPLLTHPIKLGRSRVIYNLFASQILGVTAIEERPMRMVDAGNQHLHRINHARHVMPKLYVRF